jgi:hypothetical protein
VCVDGRAQVDSTAVDVSTSQIIGRRPRRRKPAKNADGARSPLPRPFPRLDYAYFSSAFLMLLLLLLL